MATKDRPPIKAQTESRVSISPGLRRKKPKTTTTGLGHVSAGLLLWLESEATLESGNLDNLKAPEAA